VFRRFVEEGRVSSFAGTYVDVFGQEVVGDLVLSEEVGVDGRS
jgi:hypothetical protein